MARRVGATLVNSPHAFLSYASEDEALAREIAGGLKSHGFDVWYAKTSLKVGHILLDEIEKGMTNATAGILILSNAYLKKGWTNYEMDTLIRQHIEDGKLLLPVWHNVSKHSVDMRHPGLARIVALESSVGLRKLVSDLGAALSRQAPTHAVIPSYGSPVFRFFQGDGELLRGADGPAFTLWEALIHFKDSDYPMWLEGELYEKDWLLWQASQIIIARREEAERMVGSDGVAKIIAMCKAVGFDPEIYG